MKRKFVFWFYNVLNRWPFIPLLRYFYGMRGNTLSPLGKLKCEYETPDWIKTLTPLNKN